ncbi:MAG: winged helix-turn-helix domain-containing protein [Rhodoferax sp.]|nr:winged helix-turn-helix domain-containing protein [Rhodoferax sp.]MCP5264457.1 winged helix-turn-helix domain-containing protein [Rhodoferax sp.]
MPIHALETLPRRQVAARDVLVIVEDPALRELIAAHLRHQGHIVLPAAGAADACRLIAEVQPDLVLLDGDTDSARDPALLSCLRGADDNAPLPLVLLQSGASAGGLAPQLRIAKPYRPQALADAVHRLLQAGQPTPRAPLPSAGRLRAGALELDFELRAVRQHGGPATWADLAPTELRLLHHLMLQPDRTHSRADLVGAVWGAGADVDARTVDQYVRRLREALAAVGADAALKTVRGVGYRIDLRAADIDA